MIKSVLVSILMFAIMTAAGTMTASAKNKTSGHRDDGFGNTSPPPFMDNSGGYTSCWMTHASYCN